MPIESVERTPKLHSESRDELVIQHIKKVIEAYLVNNPVSYIEGVARLLQAAQLVYNQLLSEHNRPFTGESRLRTKYRKMFSLVSSLIVCGKDSPRSPKRVSVPEGFSGPMA